MSTDQWRSPTPVSLGGRERSAAAADLDFSLPFAKGDIFLGKYRIEDVIGTGGVGFVMSATNIGLNEPVALKFLRPEFTSNEEVVHRFTTEAQLAVKIHHQHVARVLDIETSSHAGPFIVMERLLGRDLNQVLQEEGPLSAERAVDYVLEACEALAAAHARGIVHRDVKPDNLFLAEQEQGPAIIKILDFGISKLTLRQPWSSTHYLVDEIAVEATTRAIGSPSYMSPEQVRAAPDIDGRADIWSLGCVLYELLTGKHAFDAPSMIQICKRVLEQPPPPLQTHGARAPGGLEAVILRCLEKAPEKRYADVGELTRALAPFSSKARELASGSWKVASESASRLPLPPRLPLLRAGRESDHELNAQSPLSVAPVALETPDSASGARKSARARSRVRESLSYGALILGLVTGLGGVIALRQVTAEVTPRPAALEPAATLIQGAAAEARVPPVPEARADAPAPSALAAPEPPPPTAKPEKVHRAVPERRVATEPSFLHTVAAESEGAALESAATSNAEADAPASAVQPPVPAPQPATPAPVLNGAARAKRAAESANKLSPSAVSSVVRAQSKGIQACFERAGADYELLRGTVTIVATLDPNGNVVHASIPSPGDGGPLLNRCLTTAASNWKFPALRGAPALVSYRLLLE